MPSSVALFEQHRPRLVRLAHRMLGSVGDAEDIVQEAYLRWHQADVEAVQNSEAWLVTVVTRLSIDKLRSAQAARRLYDGPWLPEPWLQGASVGNAEPTGELEYALLVLLERLAPEERAAYLLREIFDVDYDGVAEAVGRSEAAARQLVHRARERLAQGTTRRSANAAEKRELLQRFQLATQAQDASALTQLLAPDASYTTDGGGKVFAARVVLQGAERVVRTVLGVARKGPHLVTTLVDLDGEPALVGSRAGHVVAVTFVAVDERGIYALFKLLNPDKLSRF